MPAFFITMKLTDCLNEQSRERWPELYKRIKKREWKPPKKDKRGITCDVKIKADKEIEKKPNYAIDKQGREG